MKQQLRPNRNITMGDRGERAIKTEFTKREQREASRQSINSIKVRMKDWSDSFVLKIYRENSHPHWRAAADETMKERGTSPKTTLTREQMAPKPKKKQWKRFPKKKKHGTPEERAARSTNWKLDRALDQKLRDEP